LADEKIPLTGANVYFDGTTIAAIADERNGKFTLEYIVQV
jgi:hypothetical protein